MKEYFLPDKIYELLKWAGLVFAPAAACLIATVGPAWGMPYCDEIVLTINAIGVFIGAIIGASHLTAKDIDA